MLCNISTILFKKKNKAGRRREFFYSAWGREQLKKVFANLQKENIYMLWLWIASLMHDNNDNVVERPLR